MGFIHISGGVDVSPANAAVSEVLAPKTFFSVAPPIKTGTMPTVALDPASNAYPAGFHAGDPMGLTDVDPDLNSYNILDGIEIFGVHGSAGYYNPYYSATMKATKSVLALPAPDKTITKAAAVATEIKMATDDQPADNIKQIKPELTATKAVTALAAADESIAKNAAIAAEVGWQMLIEGYEYEHPVTTIADETAQARSGAPNDMDLAYALVNDASYFGASYPFNRVWLNIGTPGVGNWAWALEYWNGGAWVACVDEIDGTAQFMTGGLNKIQHTPQGDWATVAVNGVTLYWVRARITAFVDVTTVPMGTQCWYESLG